MRHDNRTAILAIIGALALYIICTESKAAVANDFMCGLYRATITDEAHLTVNGEDHGEHKTTMLDAESNYVHQFGDKAELRVTQQGRVAFRLKGETRWASCRPLVFYQEQTQ